jgi:hypothetical protein
LRQTPIAGTTNHKGVRHVAARGDTSKRKFFNLRLSAFIRVPVQEERRKRPKMTNEKPPYAQAGHQTGGLILHAQDGSQIEMVGTIFLGIAFLILLLAYMRVQGRYRKQLEKLAAQKN